MSGGDGVSRGIPAQYLPENQDETVKYMAIGHEVYSVDEKGEPGEVADLVMVAANGPAVPADEVPEANAEPEPVVPANPVPDPVAMDYNQAPEEDEAANKDDREEAPAPAKAKPKEASSVSKGTRK